MNELFEKLTFPWRLMFLLVMLALLTLMTEPGWSLWLLYKYLPAGMPIYITGWAISWYLLYKSMQHMTSYHPFQGRNDVPDTPEFSSFLEEINTLNPDSKE